MNDDDLFASTLARIGRVNPLTQGKYAPGRTLVQRRSASRRISQPQLAAPPALPLGREVDVVLPEATLQWCDSSAHALLGKLKRSQLAPRASADLHGCSLAEAADQLAKVLYAWQASGVTTALLVHGKGSLERPSVIKSHLPLWLQAHPLILAYCSAPLKLGGSGSLLIRLKKH